MGTRKNATMPTPIQTVTVNWPAGSTTPTAGDITVTGSPTIIRWVPGENVASVDAITGLSAPEFTAQSPFGTDGRQVTDANDNSLEYPYNITATHTAGHSADHDPKIRNGG